jgi:NitT/TauT family transport system ATP-binding protein
MPAPAVAFDRLGRAFADGTAALAEVSLAVPAGQLLSLVGPSGCGKTTLLKLTAGLDQPTAGTVVRDAQAGQPAAYVFQTATLLPWASVADNVALPLRLAGQPVDPARLAEVLGWVGLADRQAARPSELSGGQQMRVSIARALVGAPRLLLLDEPFAALDEITRQRLAELVAGLARTQRLTVLFVTHNIAEAVFLADRVVLMAGPPGHIVADIAVDGPPVRDGAFRADPAYHRQCAALSAALAEAAA